MSSFENKHSSGTDSAVDSEINDMVLGLEEVQHRLERENAHSYAHPLDDSEIDRLNEVQFDAEPNLDGTDAFNEDQAPRSDKSYTFLMVGAALFFLLLIIGLAFFGYRLLSGPVDAQVPHDSSSLGFGSETSANAIGAALGVDVEESHQEGSVSFEQAPVELDTPDRPTAESAGYQDAVGHTADTDGYLYAPGMTASEGDVVIAPPESEAMQVSVTDEEEMYDKLLGRVAESGLPLDAIRIDPQVIKSEVEGKRFDAIESEIKQTRSDVSEVRSVINEVKGQISSVSLALEANIARQDDLANQFSGLSKRQDEFTSSVASVKKVADAALSIANKAEKESRAAYTAQVSHPKPAPPKPKAVVSEPVVKKPVVQKPALAPASKPVVIAKQPKPVAVTVSGTAANPTFPAQCNGNVVSTVWRLKGVTETTAYVIRAQDNQGLFVKPGVTLPGFGEVIGFDTKARLVCTTQGLVKR